MNRSSVSVPDVLCCLLLLSWMLVGCGNSDDPPLGSVTGTVTLNGQPVDGALVEFAPAAGRPSSGITGSDGKYVLMFRDGVDGAAVGTHSVSITTRRDRSGGEGDEPVIEGQPETIPRIYNDETTLNVEVTSGDNVHDFPLEGERGPEQAHRADDA